MISLFKHKIKTNSNIKKDGNKKWVILITIWTFVLSVVISTVSSALTNSLNVVFALLILLVIILVGIVFDIIGISVTSADEKPFHAMSAKRMRGADIAVSLIRNAEKVSNFCNDVIGDIAGIVSGSMTAVIVAELVLSRPSLDEFIFGIVMTGLVASLTVGGKAFGKRIAISNANKIIYSAAVIISIFKIRKKK